MKKTILFPLAISAALLSFSACSSDMEEIGCGLHSSAKLASSGTAQAKCGVVDDKPATSDPFDQPNPGNSYPLIIEDNVKQWMDEQLASQSGEKRLIVISEMYFPSVSAPGLSATMNSAGEAEYFLNGEKITAEEYSRIWEEASRQVNTDKRDLSIPGEIKSESSLTWTVLMTADELAELSEKGYDSLAISFYQEAVNEFYNL